MTGCALKKKMERQYSKQLFEARQQIDALYRDNNPEKLAEVDTLLAKYGEDKLLQMVRKKYKVGQPGGAPTPRTACCWPPSPRSPARPSC